MLNYIDSINTKYINGNAIIVNDYEYEKYYNDLNNKNKGNYSKFIATAVEAMVAAIYIEEKENIIIIILII